MVELRKLVTVFVCLIILTHLSYPAQAHNAVLYSKNLSVKSGRLFDVDINIKSKKILTASSFDLTYNTSAVAFRNVSSSVSNAQVKASDKNGTVKVIFLIPNGVKINKKSALLSVRFKALKSGTSYIKISPSDFVDDDAENFTPPSSIKYRITADGNRNIIKNNKASGNFASMKVGKLSKSRSDDDISDGRGVEKDGILSEINSALNRGSVSFPVAALIIFCFTVTVIGLVIIVRKSKNDNKK